MNNKEYRLLPVALHPAIEEALKRWAYMPTAAWQDVIAAWDRVKPAVGEGDLPPLPVPASTWPFFPYPNTEYFTKPQMIQAMRNVQFAAPERSGKTADEVHSPVKSITHNHEFWNTVCNWRDGNVGGKELIDVIERHYSSAMPAHVASSSAAPSDERAAFEVWARRTHTRPGTTFDRSHNGVYKDNRIAAKWAAWQARAALATPSVQAVAAGQEWISVDDRQPDCAMKAGSLGIEVIVYPQPEKGESTAFFGCRITDKPDFYKYGQRVTGVTHWIPLPKPPALAGDTQAGE